MNLLDTNIIIRFLTRDDKKKADKCKKLFQEVIAGRTQLFVSDLTIAEIIWVLEKNYKSDRSDIRVKVEAILNTPNLLFQNKAVLSEGIILYEVYNIDYIDAYHAALMRQFGIKTVYSYDRDFDGFDDVRRKEP